MSREPIDPTATMAAAAAGLMSALGVAPAEQRDQLEIDCQEVLAERDHDAQVVGLQYGTLTLEAGTVAAGLLRWDCQAILEELDRLHPGAVVRIDIHPR